MFQRELNLIKSSSFFLLGARGTGKTSLLKQEFVGTDNLWIDLLQAIEERRYSDNPDRLTEELTRHRPEWVIIDEVQKVPRILDVVHKEIKEKKNKFALTGSSARKLRRNL